MDTKKKLVIATSTMAAVLVVAVVAVVIVFASLSTATGSKFTVSYTTGKVVADITAYGNVVSTSTESLAVSALTQKGETASFTGTETTGSAAATKNIADQTGSIKSSQKYVIVYKIEAKTGSSEFAVALSGTPTTSNITLSAGVVTPAGETPTITLPTSGSIEIPANTTLTASNTLYLCVVLSITNVDQNASWENTFNWTLTVVE
jgi:hypothetical protein